MYFLDASGELKSLLTSCTDVGGVDPVVELAHGRALYRYEDLLRLADLVERLFQQPGRTHDV